MEHRSIPWLRRPALLATASLLCMFSSNTALPAPQTRPNDVVRASENKFTEREAAQMINQITDALVSHNATKMLAIFDTNKMTAGPAFREQISSFFSQTTNIRVHFNLVQAGPEEGSNVVVVDAEMQANPIDDRLLPVYKEAQLRFLVGSSGGLWKFTDVQPRTFFSNTQP